MIIPFCQLYFSSLLFGKGFELLATLKTIEERATPTSTVLSFTKLQWSILYTAVILVYSAWTGALVYWLWKMTHVRYVLG